MTTFNHADLEAYLEEALPAEKMAEIEKTVRKNPALAKQLDDIRQQRNADLHSVGNIWRRHRISCPSREQLEESLSGKLPTATADYVRFHLEVIGCHYCQANLADLQSQAAGAAAAQTRRRRYFQSSAGLLRKKT